MAQGYDETIDSYQMYFLKIETGTPIAGAQTTSVVGDTSLVFAWENGTETTPPYVTQIAGSYTAMVMVNDPSIWTSGSAVVTRDIILPSGTFEITITAMDEAGYESGHSQPIYLDVKHKTAKVQVNFRIM